jgi:hypothetical protein
MLYDRDYCPRDELEIEKHLQRFQHLNHIVASSDRGPLEHVRALEEQILIHTKKDAKECEGAHILLCASDTGGYNAIAPLLDAALRDERVAAVSLNVSGAALSFLQNSPYGPLFKRIDDVLDEAGRRLPLAAKRGLLWDPEYTHAPPVSAVVVTSATYSGLENVWMLAAKAIHGVERLCFVADTWVRFSPFSGGISTDLDPTKDHDPVDAILCNDSLAQRIIERGLDGWERKPRVYATGTGVLPSTSIGDLERQKVQVEIRNKLSIPEGNKVLVLLGSYDLEGEAFRQLSSVVQTVRSLNEGGLTILLRPHPSDPLLEDVRSLAAEHPGYVQWAGRDVVSMDDVRMVGDYVVSLESTETLVAAATGVPAAFIRIESRGSDQRYSYYEDAIAASNGGIHLIDNPDSWLRFLKLQSRRGAELPARQDVARGMLNVVLGVEDDKIS